MKKIRIYELARELDMDSKDLINEIQELDIDITSHMSTLEAEEAELIKSILLDEDKEKSEVEEVEEKEEINVAESKEERSEPEEEAEEGDEAVIVEIGESIVIRELAELIEVNVAELISKLIALGVMANQNQSIDFATAMIVGEEFGVEVVKKEEMTAEEIEEELGEQEEKLEEEFHLDFEDDEKDLITRPPIVTVMGHVDHGKTSLLDAIKQTRVTDSEAGGITQHMGAYIVDVGERQVAFLDTPGHEAFTSMRARGTQVTDIAILVIAADDGVMPQTIEAISHAKAAGVPLIVAVNKMDKPEADLNKAQQELLENDLVPEEWGGSTIVVPVSAKTGEGIDELLEMVLLVAEMEQLKANPDRSVVGTIVEAQLDKGKGPMATILVQKGTLRVGDMVVSGSAIGRVRAMFNDRGDNIEEAGPSIPAVILGLSETPNAGDLIYSVKDEKLARDYAEKKKAQVRELEIRSDHKVSLDDLFERIRLGELKDLNIIIKADVRGSIEALRQSLEKLDTEEVKINIIHGGVGGIRESDIMLASASNAIVIGFNVRPNLNAIELAKTEKVDVRTYRVIYEAIEDIEAAVKGMHEPTIVEEVTGRADVRDTFKLPNGSIVAGIYVVDGKIQRNGKIRLLRDDVVMFEGDVASLRRFTDDVREVTNGYEAGLGVEGYNDIKKGDAIEAYILKEVQR